MRESGAGTLDTHEHHAERGFWRTYVFSTDHKMIGKQYLSLGLFWAVVGGLLAHVMRWQLAWPGTGGPRRGGGGRKPITSGSRCTAPSGSSSWPCRSCSGRSGTS